MPTVTIHRADVSTEEITVALRKGLGPRYNVLPGMKVSRVLFSNPQPDDPDLIVVGTGSNRLWRAQLRITRESGATQIRINPGGLTLGPVLVNSFGVTRKIRRALLNEPSLSNET
jgi:hypothetical protein